MKLTKLKGKIRKYVDGHHRRAMKALKKFTRELEEDGTTMAYCLVTGGMITEEGEGPGLRTKAQRHGEDDLAIVVCAYKLLKEALETSYFLSEQERKGYLGPRVQNLWSDNLDIFGRVCKAMETDKKLSALLEEIKEEFDGEGEETGTDANRTIH